MLAVLVLLWAAADDVAAGAKTFRSHCAPCHGLNGEGGRGPNLAAGEFYHGDSDADLLKNISQGIPGTEMPGLFYSEDRVRQLVAFIRSLSGKATPAGGADPVKGAELFRAKGCLQCHRVAGTGGRLGPDLTYVGRARAPEHLRQSIVDPNAAITPTHRVVRCTDSSGKTQEGFLLDENTYSVRFLDLEERLRSLDKASLRECRVEALSKMPSYKDTLERTELEDLVAYLSSLRPKRGAQ
jgi:putative heme-binding domain-containing protein